MNFLRFLDEVLNVGGTLTPAQRVWCLVNFDDVDPVDLETENERALAAEMFDAGEHHVERVPRVARGVVAALKGARVGGTWLCALYLLYRGLTADLSGLAAGEWGFGVIVAPDKGLSEQALRYASGAARATASIAPLIIADTTEALQLRRPDGRIIEIGVRAASRGGAATRSRSYFAALLDESALFRDKDTGIVNDSEVYRSIVVRVMTGGKTLVISTAWLESGLLHELVEANHGEPRTALASIATTELMRAGDAEMATRIAAERERDPENAAREFDCQPFTGGSEQMFPMALLLACHDAPPVRGGDSSAGGDFGFRTDSAAVATVRTNHRCHELTELDEQRPAKGAPLKPSAVVGRFAGVLRRQGAPSLACDLVYIESIREHLDEHGLSLTELPSGQGGKADVHMVTKTAAREGRVHIPRPAELTDPVQQQLVRLLISQLSKIIARPVPGGGLLIRAPRDRTGHGDVASAFLAAIWLAERRAGQGGSTSAGLRPASEFSSGPRAAELFNIEVTEDGVRMGRSRRRRTNNPGFSGGY